MISARHQLVADAALDVLARHGSRGLTHRAVDAAADLPPGSTSYYYRSRAALLSACVQRLVEHDNTELDAMASTITASDPTTLAQSLAEVLHRWLTTGRQRHLARYELTLESVRRPEVAAELRHSGSGLRQRITVILAGLHASDPPRQARWLVACIDGILFDNIAGANSNNAIDVIELNAATRDLINAVLPARDVDP
ncbi:TetR family transcriptional regulator [Actinoplanes sp. SE50]|uniref:TetR/AcrR family transcriptional regulator n=1 Tax=unclassified Actinoplanes TaxID=2626549 RepID=UPI00023EC169|nr:MULTISPECIES: TetR/AcrR family transcriptional regulator [unclassified Actinoplanes]AEV86956.1 TetR family transcriptional regulator [Actinoplanes sp. SE50/110]ATO85352.1 TetR family transcriptional regulator [Actinoplanes sp. SE50]SLM02764.1 TetR family transcriptional regulator [Actinoplanes sp. SE50/110]